ncbi:hypothetical protein IHE45_15G061400 [Dioscorea alata]|uniref:Uncharacterized protein n=1 Tax=Dioscorea alata TaxID=55571 RepID=A0ACB7ULT9_DIOAL|nr:hypothetical protein IHE45_15G061400 [Dioscorea alata]
MKSSTEDSAPELILEVADEHTVEILDDLQWIKKVTKDLNECPEKTEGPWPCTIFKVPEDIRQGDTKVYDPLVVTIGPYHYCQSKDRTVLAMQDHKWQCVRRLLSRHTKSRRKATDLLGKCLMILKELDAHVRSSYSDNLHHLTPHDLALIMLLDGCFIIHILLKFNEGGSDLRKMIMLDENDDGDDDEEEDIAAGHRDMVVLDIMGEKQMDLRVVGVWRVGTMMLYDMVKLENQIPFIIIQTLFNELKTPRDEDMNLVKIAYRLLSYIHPSPSQRGITIVPHDLPQSDQVHHLLHLFHSTIVPSSDCLEINSTEQEMDYQWIPSVTELKLAGVKFVERKASVSNFLDISFKNGTIEIPPLVLYDSSNTLFRNLIAFEQCYKHTKNYLTAYAFFMDYMIRTPKDVELLELKGILINELGTAEAAASFVNQLCYQIHDPGNSYLQGSIQGVKSYYKSKWHKLRARFMRDYFDNPLAAVSLVAALILLLLTVEQSFFAAYSYFCPPN